MKAATSVGEWLPAHEKIVWSTRNSLIPSASYHSARADATVTPLFAQRGVRTRGGVPAAGQPWNVYAPRACAGHELRRVGPAVAWAATAKYLAARMIASSGRTGDMFVLQADESQ